MASLALFALVSHLGFAVHAASAQRLYENPSQAAAQHSLLLALYNTQIAGFRLGQLNRVFDTASSRLGLAVALPEAGISSATLWPKFLPVPSQKLNSPNNNAGKIDPLLVVPLPEQVPAAYERTFRILSSHPELTDRYDAVILKYSRQYRIDPRLLKAIMAAESEFYRRALSPAGARGLMQVMPSTAEEMGVPREYLYDPEYNIRAGATYLAHLFEKAARKFRLEGISLMRAPLWLVQRVLAAYHAGPRFLAANRWYRQTRNYIRKVLLFHRSQVSEFHR